jgi:transcriptional regulator with GAF, ATPase, and Fis domain
MTQPSSGDRARDTLSTILEGTARETGEGFFKALVENLVRATGTTGAWVTEYLPESRRLRALAFRLDGAWIEDYERDIDGTPCEQVLERRRLLHIADRVLEIFPLEKELRRLGAVSYMGVPLTDLDGEVLGQMAVMDRAPMPDMPETVAVFEIFAARAPAELRRLRAERQVQEREAELAGLVDSAMDAIVQLQFDAGASGLRVSRLNPAAERMFGVTSGAAVESPLSRLLEPGSVRQLESLARQLVAGSGGARSCWITDGLAGRTSGDASFPAEATLSLFEIRGQHRFTLILRNVDERQKAERRIQTLTDEAEYLRTELRELGRAGEIVGGSPALLGVLRDVAEVGPTETTVLILGETGTGKELIARAIHAASKRRERPLVKVNCAAVPAGLIESEFFGHERGAFTGATNRRDGRFTLADGGTIFLDEVGELPLELQSKLLRVLQEGEFEPVGSSRTRKVDVRVIAATNRDLYKATREGRFREDLYYRLAVFPVNLPPLRERGDDVIILAEELARQFARRMGRHVEPLTPGMATRLKAYAWPGNVRELQNVVERAVITARDGRLNLDRALPASGPDAAASFAADAAAAPVLTAEDMSRIERENIVRALDRTEWRIAGEAGAARLLGVAPSTLSSRMKALGVRRP